MNISVYFRQNSTNQSFNTSDSWVILSDIERSIKAKIEAVGTPLKDWDITINYGIKTGYNDAFIIDGATKDRLITQDPKSAEIIRPVLRGRDIKRYSYEFADLYLITTFPSLKIDIEEFPAIKNHLLSYGYDRLKQTGVNGSRKKTNNKWYETQDSIGYWEDFYEQKIVWKAVGRNLAFSLVEAGTFITAPASFITSSYNKYILAFLCSNFGKYFIYNNSDTTGAGDIMLNIQSLEKIPIPKGDNNTISKLNDLVDVILASINSAQKYDVLQNEINILIYKLFQFTTDEIRFIENT